MRFLIYFFVGETPFQGKRGLPHTPSTKSFYFKKGWYRFFRGCEAMQYGIFAERAYVFARLMFDIIGWHGTFKSVSYKFCAFFCRERS